MLGIWSDYILPCLCAFLACVGFTLVFNIHGVGKLICGVGGALGWLISLLGAAPFWPPSGPRRPLGCFPRLWPGCAAVR